MLSSWDAKLVHYQHSSSNILVFNGNNSWEILLCTYKKSNARNALKAHEENDSYSHFTEHQNWQKSSLSNSNFNDSSQNNSISKAHTSGSNVVLQLKPSSANSSQTQLFPASLSPMGKEFLQHSLKSDQVLTGPYLRQGGSSYLMELLVQQILLHWFTLSLCFQIYPCKHEDKEHDCSHMLQ